MRFWTDGDGSTAYAATPRPLTYVRQPGSGSSTEELEQIAARAEHLTGERTTGWEHLVLSAWYLNTLVRVDAAGQTETTTLVVPNWTETWRGPDGTGTTTSVVRKPDLRTEEDRRKWETLHRPGEDTTARTEPVPPRTFTGRPPTDPAAMARYLIQNRPPGNSPGETVDAIRDLVREIVLNPAQRAAVVRVLTTVPGLAYSGTTTDRAGRAGAAFTLRTADNGVRKDTTLILDPATGRLLDAEDLLLDEGGLNVRVPCVVSYEVFEVAEFTRR